MIRDEDIEADRHLRWWLVDPIEHRKFELTEPRPDTTTFLGVEVPVIYTDTFLPPEVWVCDFCNGDIVTVVDGLTQIVPMLGGNALCQQCLLDNLTTTERAKFLSGTWSPLEWSQKGCGCEPCVLAAKKIQEER